MLHVWGDTFALLAPHVRRQRITDILRSRRGDGWTEWLRALPGEMKTYSPDTRCPQAESIDAHGKALACHAPATHVKYIVKGPGMFLQAISCERHTTELPSASS